MATEQTESAGVMYLLRRRGGSSVELTQAARGRFTWAGQYWRRGDATWGVIREDSYFTAEQKEQRNKLADVVGGDWVTVYVEVPA